MVVPQGGMHRFRAIEARGCKRRGDAVQTRIRGGCSGGGWPRPSGPEAFFNRAISSEAVSKGWTTVDCKAVKPMDMQFAIKRHLSQPSGAGAGAFDGQHGMSLGISSVAADDDISSTIASIDASGDIAAMTGRETGASARPAITRIASSRRMAKFRFTVRDSHKWAAVESSSFLHTMSSTGGC
jgi:hypothetical protein